MAENPDALSKSLNLRQFDSLALPDARVDTYDCFSFGLSDSRGYEVEDEASIYLYLPITGHAWVHAPGTAPELVFPGKVASIGKPCRHLLVSSDSHAVPKERAELVFDPLPGRVDAAEIPDFYPEALATFFVVKVPATTNAFPDVLANFIAIGANERDKLFGLWNFIELIMSSKIREFDHGKALGRRIIESIAIILSRYGLERAGAECEQEASRFYDPRIRRCLAMMYNNPQAAWTISTLSHEAGMSRSAFIEKFKQLTGATPAHYLRSLRLSRASKLLRSSNLPVSKISQEACYKEESSFIKAFSREFGVGPGKFREMARLDRHGEDGIA